MKKYIFSVLVACCFGFISYAQPGGERPGHKPPTTEEKLKHVSERLDKELSLTPEQKEKVLGAYKKFFVAIDNEIAKSGKPVPPPPPPPPPPIKKEIADKLTAERDATIKTILSAEQFAKYKTEADKMRPRHHKDQNPPAPPENQ